MDRKRIDEWQFWTLLAIADQKRTQRQIRTRMADLFRTSGASRQVPGRIDPILKALGDGGLVETLGGSGTFRQFDYRLTAAGHQACRDEIDLRRHELDAIDKDARRWLDGSARR